MKDKLKEKMKINYKNGSSLLVQPRLSLDPFKNLEDNEMDDFYENEDIRVRKRLRKNIGDKKNGMFC